MLALTAVATHATAHVVLAAAVINVFVNRSARTSELRVIIAVYARAEQASTEELQWPIGFDDDVGQVIARRIFAAIRIIPRVNAGVVFVDRLILHVDQLVVDPGRIGSTSIGNTVRLVVSLYRAVRRVIRVDDRLWNEVISIINTNEAIGRQSCLSG